MQLNNAENILFFRIIWFNYACLTKKAVIMYIYSFVIRHVYTISKIEYDYQFTFNSELQGYWILTWRLNPMLMTVILILIFFSTQNSD